jgi:hypothetical protein
MNYVDPNYEPPLFGRPADVPVPPGGPVKLVDALTRAERKIFAYDWASLLYPSVEVKFTEAGGATVKTVEPQPFQHLEPQILQHTRPDLYHRDLAEFRAVVIDTLQVEVVELRNEIAALKMDRDAKMDLARGLGAIIKNEPPTKGDVLARAIRADTPHNAYGR